VPNSHPIAANAKPESQREPQFITGHPPERCPAQVAVRLRFVSFSLRQPMKRYMQAVEILLFTKLRGNFPPFLFVRLGGQISAKCFN